MSEPRSQYQQYDRRVDDGPSREEHNDLKIRVKTIEDKLDRMTWLIIATLAATLADLYTKLHP